MNNLAETKLKFFGTLIDASVEIDALKTKTQWYRLGAEIVTNKN